MHILLALLGGIAETYANQSGGGGGPAGAQYYLKQKKFHEDDDYKYAPKIVREHESWPYMTRPGPQHNEGGVV
jgi:hypothetical protein